MDRRAFLRSALGGATLLTTLGCADWKDTCADPDACRDLYPYTIDPQVCTACGECIPLCGKEAISIPGGQINIIAVVQELCIQCEACYLVCAYDAVVREELPDEIPNKRFSIDAQACSRCLDCITACDDVGNAAIVQLVSERTRIDQTVCTHCGECVELQFCPFGAINEKRT